MSEKYKLLEVGTPFLCRTRTETDQTGKVKYKGAPDDYRRVKFVYIGGHIKDDSGDVWELARSEKSTSGWEAMQ